MSGRDKKVKRTLRYLTYGSSVAGKVTSMYIIVFGIRGFAGCVVVVCSVWVRVCYGISEIVIPLQCKHYVLFSPHSIVPNSFPSIHFIP